MRLKHVTVSTLTEHSYLLECWPQRARCRFKRCARCLPRAANGLSLLGQKVFPNSSRSSHQIPTPFILRCIRSSLQCWKAWCSSCRLGIRSFRFEIGVHCSHEMLNLSDSCLCFSLHVCPVQAQCARIVARLCCLSQPDQARTIVEYRSGGDESSGIIPLCIGVIKNVRLEPGLLESAAGMVRGICTIFSSWQWALSLYTCCEVALNVSPFLALSLHV
jgi:hypothetical protein